MSIETELKLQIAPEQVDQFVQHDLLKSATLAHAPQRLYNTYFDTPEHTLLQEGVGLRVRQIGQQRLQTLKTAGNGLGGLHQRQEWEMEISADTPDYAQFPKSVLPQWCQEKKNLEKIGPIFITDFTRTTWHLMLEEGSQIEIALDQGEVKTQSAQVPISEVELELKAGAPDKLYQVALNLQETLPLRIENKSKAALGYHLHCPKPLSYRKAGVVSLTHQMTAEQSFIHIIWHCLEHLQANEDMVLYGDDIEGVHQMRVALRRLRSCLTLYQSLIPRKTQTPFRSELKWLAQVLGVARDWDVFILSLQKMSPGNPEQLSKLQTTVEDYQTQAYHRVREALRSPRYSRLLLLLGEWLTQRGWRSSLKTIQNLDEPVLDFATQVLESHYQLVCQQGQKLAQAKATKRHKLRILIKIMAYGTRFFADLYPKQMTQNYIKKLSQLQDELGILNDGRTATELLNQIGLPDDTPVRYFFTGWYAHQQMTHMAQLETAWQSFLKQKTFWRLNTDV